MYIKRHMENTLNKYFSSFSSVLLTGPRQVGKSTLIKNHYKDIKYFSLDDPMVLLSVKQDAMGFLKMYGTPIVIDEIQRAAELFLNIKFMIDRDKKPSMYLLTGSQKYQLMKGVSESLAGRVGIVNMLGLSDREIADDSFSEPFLPNSEYLMNRNSKIDFTASSLWTRIHKGSMPELYSNSAMDREQYYASYVDTYIERDVRQLGFVGDSLSFMQFMVCLASRTGELLNINSVANDVGIDAKTAKKWISILQASNIIFLLQPFSLNINKRIIKTPKVYFTDTGLVSYLCRWLTPETLMNGAMSGGIYETFVVGEILKSYYNSGKEPNMYFFRNTDAQEVDLLFYQDGRLYPVEIKKTSSPNIKDIKCFKTLETFFPTVEIAEGGIICNYENIMPLDEKNKIIPVNCI